MMPGVQDEPAGLARPATFVDAVSAAVATGLGAGLSPVAPGTFGSAVGLLLFWPLHALPHWALAAATVLLAAAGVAAGGRLAARLGVEDPGRVVIDEVAGMWVSLLFLPFDWRTASIAFVAFRVMDVVKPWPARQLEDLPRGWGIMADDLMAGVYANLLTRVVLLLWTPA
jgi:phosphatidylglycerophosphatase A